MFIVSALPHFIVSSKSRKLGAHNYLGFSPLLSLVQEVFPQSIRLFLSVPPGARRLSASTILRFSSTVPARLRGFLSIDLLSFLRHFHVRSEVFSHRSRRLGFSSLRFFQQPSTISIGYSYTHTLVRACLLEGKQL